MNDSKDTPAIIKDDEERFEFEIEIIREKRGFVKVSARNKDHAKRALEKMSKNKMLKFYKERLEFIRIGEVKQL